MQSFIEFTLGYLVSHLSRCIDGREPLKQAVASLEDVPKAVELSVFLPRGSVKPWSPELCIGLLW